jgi:hypothetical protein
MALPVLKCGHLAGVQKSESQVTSKGLCQQERGADALVTVFVVEDGEKNACIEVRSEKTADGSGSPANLAEASFDGIGGEHHSALGERFVAPAGDQLVEIVAQAANGSGIVGFPTVGEAVGSRAGLRQGWGIHHGMQIGFDGRLIGGTNLVEHLADLVRSTTLDRHSGIDVG